jgi:hypothetical protein
MYTLNKRRFSILIIVVFCLLLTGCRDTPLKYDEWIDTYHSFGDGEYQIYNRGMVLYNNKLNITILTDVQDYTTQGDFAYVFGYCPIHQYALDGMAVIINEKNNDLDFICIDSTNVELYDALEKFAASFMPEEPVRVRYLNECDEESAAILNDLVAKYISRPKNYDVSINAKESFGNNEYQLFVPTTNLEEQGYSLYNVKYDLWVLYHVENYLSKDSFVYFYGLYPDIRLSPHELFVVLDTRDNSITLVYDSDSGNQITNDMWSYYDKLMAKESVSIMELKSCDAETQAILCQLRGNAGNAVQLEETSTITLGQYYVLTVEGARLPFQIPRTPGTVLCVDLFDHGGAC